MQGSQMPNKMNQLKEMVSRIKAMKDPNSMLNYIVNQNQQAKEFLEIVKRNNGDFEKSFMEYAPKSGKSKQEIDEALKQAKQLFK